MTISSKVKRDHLLNSLPAEEREHLISESVVIEVSISILIESFILFKSSLEIYENRIT